MLPKFERLVRRASSSKVLLAALGIQASLIILRTLNLHYTGFQTPDEVNYILDAMIGRPYGNRFFFDGQLWAFFQLFGINSIARFYGFFPFYLVFWTFSFIFLTYKTLGLITRNPLAKDFVLLSIPFAISYSLLSVGLLSEGPGLTMCMLGIYSWLRYSRIEKRWWLAALCAGAFLAAAYSREPYSIFPVVGSIVWIILTSLRSVPWKHAATFVVISLMIVAPNSPLYGVTGPTPESTPAQTALLSGQLPPTSITSTSPATSAANSSPLSGWASILRNSLILFFYGTILGLGPGLSILAAFALGMLLIGRRSEKRPLLLLIMTLLSLATFYGSTIILSNQSSFLLGRGLSNLIRLTNTIIPAYILLSATLVDRLSARRIKILAGLVVGLTILSAGFYVAAVQSNFSLPYNVLEFNHLSEPLEARNYILGNASLSIPTTVFISSGWQGAELYLRDIPGVLIYPNVNIPQTVYRSNYTESYFLMVHPTTFYVLSEQSFADWNSSASLSSNVYRMMIYQAPFLIKTFGHLYNVDTSGYPSTPYSIDTVKAFNSPTGLLLEVHVNWEGQ